MHICGIERRFALRKMWRSAVVLLGGLLGLSDGDTCGRHTSLCAICTRVSACSLSGCLGTSRREASQVAADAESFLRSSLVMLFSPPLRSGFTSRNADLSLVDGCWEFQPASPRGLSVASSVMRAAGDDASGM